MAISIDNARTHDQLERLLEERSKALASAEAQVRSLFEDSPLGIALTSYEGQVLAVNKAILQMLRITEEEMLQRNVARFYCDPGDRDALLSGMQELGFVQDFGAELVRNDGSSFYASLNVSRLVLGDDEVLLAMIEDVTDQITAEQESAVLEERARLARDLHDAVTQTLFSASLLADTTPRIWEKDQTIATQNLNQLGRLLRGALAEMRTLLFELRTEAMKDQTLGQLLGPLTEAARARARAEVDLQVEGDRPLPPSVTMALHRIAQESLNNVAKHAEATKVDVDLKGSAEGVVLRISDDGRGFDPGHIPPGHLGVGIMTERAREVGAVLTIESQRGRGTQVVVTWSDQGEGDVDD
jgi:PAS domain S-box-containing protein